MSAPTTPTPPPVDLITGSNPCPLEETRCLWQGRLGLAALVIALSLVVFLVWQLLIRNEPWGFAFGVQLAAALVLLAVAGGARRCSALSEPKLWALEAVVFALPGVVFVIREWTLLPIRLEASELTDPLIPWIVLILVRSLLIPGRWLSALPLVVACAAAPVAVTGALCLAHPTVAGVITTLDLLEQGLVMAVVAGIALTGVRAVHDLRLRAFHARRFGQYRLLEVIGEGGMGTVYRAEHLLLKRPCAIKVVKRGSPSDNRALDRFEREVRSAAALTHWNTIAIFDFGRTSEGTFYYVMELLPGASVEDVIAARGPMPASRVIAILSQVCAALNEAHAQGLVHRDIKPSNIMLTERGGVLDVVKLVDFGLVRPVSQREDNRLTEAGLVVGTPLFMSPEQALGKTDIDGRADLYSLGATAYLMLTGHALFDRDTPMSTLVAHIREEVIPPSSLAEVPADLEAIILRLLEKDAGDRFPSAEALSEALLSCRDARTWDQAHARLWWETFERERSAATAASTRATALRPSLAFARTQTLPASPAPAPAAALSPRP